MLEIGGGACSGEVAIAHQRIGSALRSRDGSFEPHVRGGVRTSESSREKCEGRGSQGRALLCVVKRAFRCAGLSVSLQALAWRSGEAEAVSSFIIGAHDALCNMVRAIGVGNLKMNKTLVITRELLESWESELGVRVLQFVEYWSKATNRSFQEVRPTAPLPGHKAVLHASHCFTCMRPIEQCFGAK